VDDYEDLRDRMSLAERVGAVMQTRTEVRYGGELLEDIQIAGVTPNLNQIRELEVGIGRPLTDADELHHAAVCFVGPDLVQHFFPNTDPIGKSIRVGPAVYEIVGVAKVRGSVLGQTQDSFVQVPLGTYRKTFLKQNDTVIIFIQARRPELMEAAADEARVMLRARRHVRYQDPDNFGIILPSSITGLWQELTSNIFSIALSLTSVFLVVGGIVIMNIMLASVTERTREIGIRKSLGARRRQIVMQFLVESSLLAAVGGLLGVAAALAISGLVRLTTPIPISTPLNAIVIALALSTSVGLFFGIYPAVRASRLEPIEALRSET
jgi:putative ABC transport system permease protein